MKKTLETAGGIGIAILAYQVLMLVIMPIYLVATLIAGLFGKEIVYMDDKISVRKEYKPKKGGI